MKLKGRKILCILLVMFICIVGSQSAFANASARTMHFGHSGDDVLRLQKALKEKGYYNYHLDGIYGLITERAVINFEIDYGLKIDGIAGPETQAALYGLAASSSNNNSFDSGDVYWLARIIEAEAGGESYEGKVAVGNVILNRVNSKDFPNTVYTVIFEYYGRIPQFSPVAEGTIYNTPSQESINAAKDAINGFRPVGNATYFFNTSKAAGTWILNNKQFVATIGGHTFYQ